MVLLHYQECHALLQRVIDSTLFETTMSSTIALFQLRKSVYHAREASLKGTAIIVRGQNLCQHKDMFLSSRYILYRTFSIIDYKSFFKNEVNE